MGRVWFLIQRGRVDFFASYFYRREEASRQWSIATAVGRMYRPAGEETKEIAAKHRVKVYSSYTEEVLW